MKTLTTITRVALAFVIIGAMGVRGESSLSAAQPPSARAPVTYQAKLAEELRNPECADLFHRAQDLCGRGECDRAHQVYRALIQCHPDSALALECRLLILGCYLNHGKHDAADEMRKELVRACEKRCPEGPTEPWTADVCSMAACCCARVLDPSPEWLERAERFARFTHVAHRARLKHTGYWDPALVWQEAEARGLVCEKRQDWASAIRVYDDVIHQLTPPQRWTFELKLVHALTQRASQINETPKTGPAIEGVAAGERMLARERAEAILERLTSDTARNPTYSQLTQQAKAELKP